MDVVNFPAILAQYGLLKPGDVITYDDLILIGKKVNDKRNGSQYQELAMTIQDFLSMAGGGGSPTFCSITLQQQVTIGPTIFFDHPSGTFATVWDPITPDVHLTRDPNCGFGCLFNLAAGETCCDGQQSPGSSPVNTEWFWVQNPMTYDYAQAPTETYKAFLDWAYNDWPCGGMICAPGQQMIMHDTVNDEYWIIDFVSWQSGGQGGFSWNRRKLTVTCDGCIHFPDGSVQCTAATGGGAVSIPASDYYVDANFGNDGTALPNRLDKPYATINAALGAAQGFPPATVYVRAGIYSEGFIQMRNAIKVYCEPGVEIRDTVISDAGADITMGWYGKADLTGVSYVTATGFTNLTFEFNTAETARTFLLINPTAGKIVRMNVSGKKVYTDGAFGFGATFRGQTEGVMTIEESFTSKAGNGTLFFRGGAASYSGDVTIICPKIIQQGSVGSTLIVSESATDKAKVKIVGDLISEVATLGPYNSTVFCRRGEVEIYGDVIAKDDSVIPMIIDGGFNVGAGHVNVYGDVKVEDGTAVFVSHRNVPLYVQGGLIQGGAKGQYGKGVIIVGNSLPGLPGNPDVWCYVKDCRVLKNSGADTIVELTGNIDSDHRILAYNTEFKFPAPGGGPVCVTASGPRTPGFVYCVANGTMGGGMTDLFVPSGFTTINNLIIPRF